MKEKPLVKSFEDGSKIWNHTFESFEVQVYKPVTTLQEQVLNYGLTSPYLLVFEEEKLDENCAKEYADNTGLSAIAAEHASTVVFVYPTCEEGWKGADEQLFVELIEKSKIHQYFEDGYAILNNRFTKTCDGYAIRGAIYKTFLYGKGASADYIGRYLTKTIQGAGLWGPADVTPTLCVLENLSEKPLMERRDMPIVSVGNTEEMNAYLRSKTEDYLEQDLLDWEALYRDFAWKFKRWGWVGDLQLEPDFEALGMVNEEGIFTIKVSEDNLGDDKDRKEHPIGYFAYYNKGIFDDGPVPLLLCFHGGGDSAKHIAHVSEWYKVAHDYDFLLICVENHLESTATEMMDFLGCLKEKYKIDDTAIYATGFSMGGCKSWDLYQEYPDVFAGIAPMDATFDKGCNFYGQLVQKPINANVVVPIFYAGGEITPLPELPFQAQKCIDRMKYVLCVNQVPRNYDVKLEEAANWENPIWGINGDRTEVIHDASRDSDLTLQYFDSEDGLCYTVFGSVSGQGHECRHHTCEQAWKFLSAFGRVEGKIIKKR